MEFKLSILKTSLHETGQGNKGNEGDKEQVAKIQENIFWDLLQSESLSLNQKIGCLLNEWSKLLINWFFGSLSQNRLIHEEKENTKRKRQ